MINNNPELYFEIKPSEGIVEIRKKSDNKLITTEEISVMVDYAFRHTEY